ncbi:divalent cation tolerance protein CutA [Sediminitomix flava]|uniref:CutA1 divalent ion tolerance protein n=1 Tax=Sediminitomix flava TaxID=379075 RepID=A0A315ZD88_SEDFL|nr:divalent cation tolerance protein CutA [Sediminitomix flava]PWJ43272.1 CutA1 divalent ion tolerance protein [Sediminitomix flava]
MIVLHIVSDNQEQANEIITDLLQNKLIINAISSKIEEMTTDEEGEIVSKSKFLIMGKTKALLFEKIDTFLNKKYKENMPTLYSVPIVNMDWDQAHELVEGTAKV